MMINHWQHGLLGILMFGLLPIQGNAQPYDRPGPKGRVGSRTTDRGGIWSQEAIKYDRAFTGILNSAAKLADKNISEDANAALNQLKEDATFLQQRWREWANLNRGGYQPNAAVDPYYKGLNGVQRLLDGAAKETQAAKAAELIDGAARDIHLKAGNCRNSEDGLGKVIRVRVRTVSGTNEVAGYEVWFVTRGMMDVKAARDRFYKLSSPTDELDLAPGRYALWGEKDGVSSGPVILGVGGKGQTQVEIDLAIAEPKDRPDEQP